MKKNRWVRIRNLSEIFSKGITNQPMTKLEREVYNGYRKLRSEGHQHVMAYEVDGEIRFKTDNLDSMRRIRLHRQQ